MVAGGRRREAPRARGSLVSAPPPPRAFDRHATVLRFLPFRVVVVVVWLLLRRFRCRRRRRPFPNPAWSGRARSLARSFNGRGVALRRLRRRWWWQLWWCRPYATAST
jgi:hypothetical protein